MTIDMKLNLKRDQPNEVIDKIEKAEEIGDINSISIFSAIGSNQIGIDLVNICGSKTDVETSKKFYRIFLDIMTKGNPYSFMIKVDFCLNGVTIRIEKCFVNENSERFILCAANILKDSHRSANLIITHSILNPFFSYEDPNMNEYDNYEEFINLKTSPNISKSIVEACERLTEIEMSNL